MNKITHFCTSGLYMTMLELGRKFPTKSKHREETCKYVVPSYPRIKPSRENTISQQYGQNCPPPHVLLFLFML